MNLENIPVDSLQRLSRVRAALFLLGTAAVGLGLWLARSKGTAGHPVGQSNEALQRLGARADTFDTFEIIHSHTLH